jgi:hypothetical protein
MRDKYFFCSGFPDGNIEFIPVGVIGQNKTAVGTSSPSRTPGGSSNRMQY